MPGRSRFPLAFGLLLLSGSVPGSTARVVEADADAGQEASRAAQILSLASWARAQLEKDDPAMTYQAVPSIPTEDQELAHAREATNEAAWAASEAHAAAAQARTSEAEEKAVQQELDATTKALQTKLVLKRAAQAAEKSIQFKHDSESSAQSTRQMEDEIEPIAQAAAKRAVAEVVAKAIHDMNMEAGMVRDQALAERKAAFLNAAKMANDEALPFQQALVRAKKNSIEYITRANELAQDVTLLKAEAMRIGGTAGAYQSAGIPVIAHRMLNKAHDMMDKAIQMQGLANKYQSSGSSMQGTFLGFTLAAGAAQAFGAYSGNPAGVRPDIGALPSPLSMPPVAEK